MHTYNYIIYTNAQEIIDHVIMMQGEEKKWELCSPLLLVYTHQNCCRCSIYQLNYIYIPAELHTKAAQLAGPN